MSEQHDRPIAEKQVSARRAWIKGAAGIPLVFTVPSGRVWATSSVTCVGKNAKEASVVLVNKEVVAVDDNWLRIQLSLFQVERKQGSAWTPISPTYSWFFEGFSGTYWGVVPSGGAYSGGDTGVSVAAVKGDTAKYRATDTGKKIYALAFADTDGNIVGYGFQQFAGSARSNSCASSYPVKTDRYQHMGRRIQRV